MKVPLSPALVLAAALLAGCAGGGPAAATDPTPAAPAPGTVAYDQSVFHAMLREHEKIRRKVTLRPDGAETLTESDDPAIAAKLIDHVTAMKDRVHTGRRIRQWDPLYIALFDNADKIELTVTPTAKGVRVIETSKDPHVAEMLKAHARAVSGFAAEGFDEAARSHPVPPAPTEASAGGGEQLAAVQCGSIARLHELGGVFLASQPGPEDFAAVKACGVRTVINLRRDSELRDFDEKQAVETQGMTYISLPFGSPAEMTDEVLDRARAELKAAPRPILMHCASANRVGAVWLPYRVLDGGLSWDDAVAEAKVVGLRSAELEAKARDYVERRSK